MTHHLDAWASSALADLSSRHLERHLRLADACSIDLCSNDYLGLGARPLHALGPLPPDLACGSTASRLIRGHTRWHAALEEALAAWVRSPAALLFHDGWAANAGGLGALVQPGDRVFSDALNHASLIDALRLTRAHRVVYPHQDLDALARGLATPWPGGRTWVVTEGVFSMDGDATDLPALLALAETHDAVVWLDEAHSLGVLGPRGGGLAEAAGLTGHPRLVRMGTLGKAVGSEGAFVASSAPVRQWLVQRARPLVFSTAASPLCCWVTLRQLDEVVQGVRTRALWCRIEAMAHALRRVGVWSGTPASAIFPVVVGDEAPTLALASALREGGFDVVAIRPPTVPAGTCRLRVTVRADLGLDTIEAFADALGARMPARPLVSGAGLG